MTSAGPDAEDRPTPAWRLLRGRIGRRMPADPQVAAIVRVAGLAYVLLAAINVARATTYLPAGRLPYFSDSLVFLRTGASAPWSLDLWAGTYPFGYPLAIRILGEGVWLHVGQAALAAAAWLWLAREAAASTQRPGLKLVAFGWILGISLAPEVAGQHQLVMTESLSFSALVGLVALALRWRRTGDVNLLWWSVPLVIMWVELRKSNVVVLAALVGVAALWWLFSRRRQALAVGAVALLVIVGSSWLGSRTNQSSQTITKWVLDVGIPDPDAREFLAERGMPTSEAVLDLGGMAYSASDRLAVDPRLKDFRAWMATEASGAYAAWLLSHPSELVVQSGRALSQSFSDIDIVEAHQKDLSLAVLGLPGAGPLVLPAGIRVGGLVWLRPHCWLVGWVGITIVAATVALARRPDGWRDGRWQIGWFLLATAPLHGAVSFYGDIVAQSRHGLGAAVQLRVALILVGVWACEELLAGRDASRTGGGRSAVAGDEDASETALTARAGEDSGPAEIG
ncbi:MAG: hypothetical protein IPH81_17440 [Candidatus Microthrix sp.]|nr:hypothetical protein [Candidatus Microthrix sp.]